MDVIEKYASYHSTAAVKMQQYSDAFRPTIKVCGCYSFLKILILNGESAFRTSPLRF